MELSSSKIKTLSIFQKMKLSSSKIKEFLYFREWNFLALNCSYISGKFFLYFGKWNLLKTSYISGNRTFRA